MAKKYSRWEGEGDKGGKGGEKTGKIEGKKVRNGKEKKRENHGDMRGRIEPPSRIDLAQESDALPVTYCDSQASVRTVLDFYCDSDLI